MLTETVNREFRVDRVSLVHRDKLPRIRARLGFGTPVSEVKKTIRGWDFFESAEAFAVVRQRGTPEEVEHRCLEAVREELSILAMSQLGYSNREQMRPVALSGEDGNSYIRYLGVSSRNRTTFGKLLKWTGGATPIALDARWKAYQDGMFFTKLLKILRGETKVAAGWRGELRRASVLIGESVGANDLLKSFVWNMVALEMLLTTPEDKLQETLPKRAEAFLGWVGFWESENYEARIEKMYDKRNDLLHRGRRENITRQDLAFMDALLLNLLINLVSYPKLFDSKDKVIEFSRKVEAERVLGLRPRVRPKDLRFVRRVRPDF